MLGIVKGLTRNKQRAAVLTDYGYTVLYIEHGEVSIEYQITGNLDDHGSQGLTNQTTRKTLFVYRSNTGNTFKHSISSISYMTQLKNNLFILLRFIANLSNSAFERDAASAVHRPSIPRYEFYGR